MKVGKTIRQLRLLRGYSQEYMALQLMISQKTYSRIENDASRIDIERLVKISDILDVDLSAILEYEKKESTDWSVPVEKAEPNWEIDSLYQYYEERIKRIESHIAFLRMLVIKRSG